MVPEGVPQSIKRIIDFLLILASILDSLWTPFGLPLGSLWRPFGHPIDAVWSQRALPGRSGSSKALHSEPYTPKSSPRFRKWAKSQPQIEKNEPLSVSKIENYCLIPLKNYAVFETHFFMKMWVHDQHSTTVKCRCSRHFKTSGVEKGGLAASGEAL